MVMVNKETKKRRRKKSILESNNENNFLSLISVTTCMFLFLLWNKMSMTFTLVMTSHFKFYTMLYLTDNDRIFMDVTTPLNVAYPKKE